MEPSRRELIGAGLAAALGAATRSVPAASVSSRPAVGGGKIGPHLRLSLAAYSLRQYLPSEKGPGKITLHDLLELCAVWGTDALEPTSYYFTSEDRAYLHSLKAKAFRLGLDISGTAVRNDFCVPPGPQRERELAHVRRWVDHAVELGAPVIRVFAGKRAGDREEDFARVVDGLKHACDYAGSHGVFLAIENHGYLTENAADVLRIVETVGHEWLGVNLDTGNFQRDGYESIRTVAPRAITVQVKVAVRDAEGREQPADFRRIIGILRDANYRGYVALEYEAKEDPMTAVPAYLARLREALEA